MSSWVPAQSRELFQTVLPAHKADTAVTRLYNASAEVTVADVSEPFFPTMSILTPIPV